MLTLAEKQDIKRKIGAAFLLILKTATIRIILQKNPADRSEKDIDRLIHFLKEIDYFKNNKELTYGDYRELSQLFTYREYDTNCVIYSKGDIPRHFFILLNGRVSQIEKNEIIDEWDWAMSVYKGLLEWKLQEFDPKLAQAIQ